MIINMIGGGSGGAALNFDVVRYATESELLAATPKANTIGIISTTEMTGWIIDANQPENMTNGMVWLSVGTESTVEFNALKKNALQVYLLSAKQMVSGALMNVAAMIYQDGEWNELWDGGLFANGNQYEFVTGGWSSNGCTDPGYTIKPATVGNTIHLTASSGILSISCTEEMVNLSGKKKLVVNLSQRSSGILYVGITKNKGNIYDDDLAVLQLNDVGIHELTIPDGSGQCYVYAGLWSAGDLQVSEIRAV